MTFMEFEQDDEYHKTVHIVEIWEHCWAGKLRRMDETFKTQTEEKP